MAILRTGAVKVWDIAAMQLVLEAHLAPLLPEDTTDGERAATRVSC